MHNAFKLLLVTNLCSLHGERWTLWSILPQWPVLLLFSFDMKFLLQQYKAIIIIIIIIIISIIFINIIISQKMWNPHNHTGHDYSKPAFNTYMPIFCTKILEEVKSRTKKQKQDKYFFRFDNESKWHRLFMYHNVTLYWTLIIGKMLK